MVGGLSTSALGLACGVDGGEGEGEVTKRRESPWLQRRESTRLQLAFQAAVGGDGEGEWVMGSLVDGEKRMVMS